MRAVARSPLLPATEAKEYRSVCGIQGIPHQAVLFEGRAVILGPTAAILFQAAPAFPLHAPITYADRSL